MSLEVIIIFLVFIPVLMALAIRHRKTWRGNMSGILTQLVGNFLLVSGILMLFPAFYIVFHVKEPGLKVLLLVVSFLFIAIGYLLTNRPLKKP